MLGEDRGYQANDRSDPGILDHQPVPGGIPKHAQRTAHIVTDLIAAGIAPHEIAVLYPRNRKKIPLRDWLVNAFDAANLPVATERAQPWPRGRIVAFLQKIANWQLSRQTSRAHPTAARFDELADDYAALRTLSWHHVNERLAARVDLWQAVVPAVNPDQDLPTWVTRLDQTLSLTPILLRTADAQETAALRQLRSARWPTATIGEFAGDVEAVGKIVVTTYHSSKGREWPYVILPALQEGVVPDWPLDYGRPYLPGLAKVAEERRLFYVALTRAQRAAILIYTPGPTATMRYPTFHASPSRFITHLPGFNGNILPVKLS